MKFLASLFAFILLGSVSYVFIPVSAYASTTTCQCVLYLRTVLGVDIHGNANTIKANIPFEYVVPGDVLLFHYDYVDHVALITAIHTVNGQTVFDVSESNFHHCKPGSRAVYASDSSIRGVFRPQSFPQSVIDIAL